MDRNMACKAAIQQGDVAAPAEIEGYSLFKYMLAVCELYLSGLLQFPRPILCNIAHCL